jgi:hypothetical protein
VNPREEISMEENSRGQTDTWVLITVEMRGKNVQKSENRMQ